MLSFKFKDLGSLCLGKMLNLKYFYYTVVLKIPDIHTDTHAGVLYSCNESNDYGDNFNSLSLC